MLVLSRKSKEEFRFPQLGINVQVISVQGKKVRIGIDAPENVSIIRGELAAIEDNAGRMPMLNRHDFANRLNSIKLGLHLATRQYELGKNDDAKQSLCDALHGLTLLEQSVNTTQVAPKITQKVTESDRASHGKDKTVLVVDDDRNECRLLAGLLELEGYHVVTAENGISALNQLRENIPDFVLLDMMMPEMDGRETIQEIRNTDNLADLKVFSVSGTCPEDLGVVIGPTGVDEWFPKPLNPSEMLIKIRSLTNQTAA